MITVFYIYVCVVGLLGLMIYLGLRIQRLALPEADPFMEAAWREVEEIAPSLHNEQTAIH